MKPQYMTGDDLNRRVAELCGAKWMRLLSDDSPVQKRSLVMPEEIESFRARGLSEADGTEDMCQIHRVPNYAGDLNAMHEAEATIPDYDGAQESYHAALCAVTNWAPVYCSISQAKANFDLIRATARQRAEAFVMAREGTK